MDQITHTVRYSMWKDIILKCQNRPVGMNVKQWLAENHISEKSYYYWQRKFRKEAYDQIQYRDSWHIEFLLLVLYIISGNISFCFVLIRC
ncbi:hypothetical protein [Anaerosporobacter faecicola]|uniref:hypothetical protein n=1 Tax=Anaerosporobacter faecicola TaxID=2718714 RepID=UPI001438D092|nr:hypothetical protein [Anaerosporobacter faecicola]